MPICADLLVLGAQAVLRQAARDPDHATPWLSRLLREKPRKVAAVALANKTARIVWALLARGEAYGSPHDPSRPAVSAKGKGSFGGDGATVEDGSAQPRNRPSADQGAEI